MKIAVMDTQNISLHAPDHFMVTCREAFNELANSPDTGGGRQKYGTNIILSLMDETGNVIGFLMECLEKGILKKPTSAFP